MLYQKVWIVSKRNCLIMTAHKNNYVCVYMVG